jgi:tetratricopeptide (TPR) repeat protein
MNVDSPGDRGEVVMQDASVTIARRLIRLLRRSGALERDPAGIELRQILGTPTVREATHLVIERALHAEHPLCRDIVQRCDVQDRPTDVVALELGLSLRSMFRYRRRAIDAVAAELHRTLVGDGARARGVGRAAQLTLLGNFLLSLYSSAGNAAALQAFSEAVAVDPRWTDGYVGLSLAHVKSVVNLYRRPFEAYARAATAAKRALQLNPLSAGANAAAGIVALRRGADAVVARRYINQAMALDASDPAAVQALGELALSEGNVEAAEAAALRGLALEPSSMARRCRFLMLASLRGNFGHVIAECTMLLESDPALSVFRMHLVDALIGDGRPAEALSAAGAPEAIQDPYLLGSVVAAHAALNDIAAARRVADLLDGMPCATYNRAQVRALVADVDGALATLGRAVAEDPRCRGLAAVDPSFAALERIPSFRGMIAAS